MKDGPRNAQTAGKAPLPPEGSNRGEIPPFSQSNGGAIASSTWQQLFHRLPLAQKRQLLDQANHQGYLSFREIPNPGNSIRQDSEPAWLTEILAGQIECLEPLRELAVDCFDSSLDETQRRAVAAALQTPDLSLIQGLPGTGKSRVVAEIIHQATVRGERVLYVSPWANALDNVLISQAGKDSVSPWQLLAPDEIPDSLSHGARPFISPERLRNLQERVIPAVDRQAQESNNRLRRLQTMESVWPCLLSWSRRHGELARQINELSHFRLRLATNLEAEFASIGEITLDGNRLIEQQTVLREKHNEIGRLESELKALGSQILEKQKEFQDLDEQLFPLKPLIDAKTHGRFWTMAWWQAIFSPGRLAQARDMQARWQQARQVLEKLTDRAKQVSGELKEHQEVFESDRKKLIQKEIEERLAEATQKAERPTREIVAIEQSWRSTCLELPNEISPPADLSEEAVVTAESRWKENLAAEVARGTFLSQWLDHLQKEPEEVMDSLFQTANLILSTAGNIPEHAVFRGSIAGAAFDLLVLEGAHKVTEAEFARMAGCCRRCVLIGEPSVEPPQASSSSRKQNGFQTLKSSIKPGIFQRLWSLLHCDPRQLPYRWRMEQDHLCCQLRRVKPEQRHWLELEPVADHPEIELRILNMPRKAPVLAEVAFPRSMSIVQAKEYIFNEIQELAVQAAAGNVKWTEHPDRIAFGLSDQCSPQGTSICLAPGVFELVEASRSNSEPNPWHTCCLEFHREIGWQRLQAEEWVEKQLGLKDLGRTVCLETAYRMSPMLGQFLWGLLFQGQGNYKIPIQAPGRVNGEAVDENHFGDTPVEFVPVSASQGGGTVGQVTARDGSTRRESKGAATCTLTRHGLSGVGQELDLADFAQRSRLPSELAFGLPAKGLVNYDEAQSVVYVLESLVSEFSASGRIDEPDNAGWTPTIGIMALYPAQVELIRRLIDQIPGLVASPISFVVDVPEGFRERECAIVLLGLTRSHGYRATSLGGDPQTLALALSRARKKLFIFGDPETLIRRSQWDGVVEPLDEQASAVERGIVARLVSYIQGQETHPTCFRIRQGGWT